MNEGALLGSWVLRQGFQPPSCTFSVRFLTCTSEGRGFASFYPEQPAGCPCSARCTAGLWCVCVQEPCAHALGCGCPPICLRSSGIQKMLYLGPQCPQGGEPGSNPALLTRAGVWPVTYWEDTHCYVLCGFISFSLHTSEPGRNQACSWRPRRGGLGIRAALARGGWAREAGPRG